MPAACRCIVPVALSCILLTVYGPRGVSALTGRNTLFTGEELDAEASQMQQLVLQQQLQQQQLQQQGQQQINSLMWQPGAPTVGLSPSQLQLPQFEGLPEVPKYQAAAAPMLAAAPVSGFDQGMNVAQDVMALSQGISSGVEPSLLVNEVASMKAELEKSEATEATLLQENAMLQAEVQQILGSQQASQPVWQAADPKQGAGAVKVSGSLKPIGALAGGNCVEEASLGSTALLQHLPNTANLTSAVGSADTGMATSPSNQTSWLSMPNHLYGGLKVIGESPILYNIVRVAIVLAVLLALAAAFKEGMLLKLKEGSLLKLKAWNDPQKGGFLRLLRPVQGDPLRLLRPALRRCGIGSYVVELSEVQVGNIFVGGDVFVRVNVPSTKLSIRTKHITSANIICESNEGGHTLKFNEGITLNLSRKDDLVSIVLVDLDPMKEDSVAVLEMPAQKLLSHAWEDRQYFRFEVSTKPGRSMKGRVQTADKDDLGDSPYFAMRVRDMSNK